jgi:hypothetical protein
MSQLYDAVSKKLKVGGKFIVRKRKTEAEKAKAVKASVKTKPKTKKK